MRIGMPNAKATTLKEAFESFVRSKKAMNCSEKTIFFYENIYSYFIEFFSEDNLCAEIS